MLSRNSTFVIILLALSASSSAAPWMIATDESNPSEVETYSHTFHFSESGLHSLIVHEDFCELDLANNIQLEIRNFEFLRRKEANDRLIAYFFPCEKLSSLNINNYENVESLKVYKFDTYTESPDVGLRISLLDMGDNEGSDVSKNQAEYLSTILGLKGSFREGHEITRLNNGDVRLGFSLASFEDVKSDTLVSLWLSDISDVYVFEQTRGLGSDRSWGTTTKNRHIRALEFARLGPGQAQLDSRVLDEKPSLIPSYFLENVIFYAQEEFRRGVIGAPIFQS